MTPGAPSPGGVAGDAAFRVQVLRAHGASDAELGELLSYTENRFDASTVEVGFPLLDEPFVEAWEEYVAIAEREGVFACLRDRFPQLRFPVRAGIGATEAYRAATRRGEWTPGEPEDGGLRLRDPGSLRLLIHPTPAGRIPVLIAGEREDFVALVRAFTRRGEPDPVPDAMGACMVAGYNNWDRIHRIRARWEADHPEASAGEWREVFRGLVPRRELYQDRFVLLSRGPYSAVPAGAMGLEPDEWDRLSLTIRLEHECAHFFTRRVLGSMQNALHDELIADSVGILAAAGGFRADWFLRFMGLEDFPDYRAGGRLQNYRGTPPLSDGAFRVLQSLVVAAAWGLERFSARAGPGVSTLEGRAAWIVALAGRSLEELASAAHPPIPAAHRSGAATHPDPLEIRPVTAAG